ncbi:MAG: pilus assembly protein [Chloroflexota bacterium]|nr:pilus assembly protein [Chloroflexota bacterium]
MTTGTRRRGQALVEFALIAPLLFLIVGGIMTLGIGVFYQQQLTNAAREAARYAAIHSETSQCPTISNRDPHLSMLPPDYVDYDCDPPWSRWPEMTAHARSMLFGLNGSGVQFSACWSGYWDTITNGWDAAPLRGDGSANEFKDCTIGGIDPRVSPGSIPCPPPLTTLSDDMASSLAHSGIETANQVTVYACYDWHPPFAAELIGGPITMRAVITEAMQHQK